MIRRLLLAAALCLFAQPALAVAPQTVCLTSGTTWTVPADWNSISNTVELVGAGRNTGGGGGAYSKKSNYGFAGGQVVSIQVAAANAETQTCFVSCATQKASSAHGTSGGTVAASVGTVLFRGGDGGVANQGGGGGAGPHGAGVDAGATTGGAGDAGFGGAGGAAGLAGHDGAEWTCTSGTITGPAGAGGGGGGGSGVGGDGGNYGAGSGQQSVGASTGGLIVITYTPGRRVSSGVF